ncbi:MULTISPECIES: hypothetical protein [unclassified Nostoc]|nr:MULTISPECIES: hypothetical protein [unclassified Nostoc]
MHLTGEGERSRLQVIGDRLWSGMARRQKTLKKAIAIIHHLV